MSEPLLLNGKEYVSSKSAAQNSGYAQDYIGQLSRGGLIDAQRVGGLWYVSMDSLLAYKKNADLVKPVPPQPQAAYDPEAIVSFDGKDYVSASRAAKLTGYHQDYVGQLARKGAVLSRQIGNRWYVDREGLIAHKSEKDRLLAAVQSEAVGLNKPGMPRIDHESLQSAQDDGFKTQPDMQKIELMTYRTDEHDLFPQIQRSPRSEIIDTVAPKALNDRRSIPIRAIKPSQTASEYDLQPPIMGKRVSYRSPERKRASYSLKTGATIVATLTIVVLLGYGFISLKDYSEYASGEQSAYTAAAHGAVEYVGSTIEYIVAPEVVYRRK